MADFVTEAGTDASDRLRMDLRFDLRNISMALQVRLDILAQVQSRSQYSHVRSTVTLAVQVTLAQVQSRSLKFSHVSLV
jgi:hypothetical protein